MFEVLVYLYETYWRPDACPDHIQLRRKLSAAGFAREEIQEALSWLDGLAGAAESYSGKQSADAVRVYSTAELERLGEASIGFIRFLESAGVLPPTRPASSSMTPGRGTRGSSPGVSSSRRSWSIFSSRGMSGRQRPFYEDGVDHWTGPAAFFGRFDADNEGRYDSFPSGHTATAFGVATVVALQYRHRPWVPVLAYTIASGVALSRLTEDRHWASDVLVGAVIGHLIARLVVRSHRQRHGIAPVIGFSRRSVTIGFNYLGPAGP